MANGTCSIAACGRPVVSKGFCKNHYSRLWKYGDPLGAAPKRPANSPDRFWAKVDKNGPVLRDGLGPCWIWTKAVNANGYGILDYLTQRCLAHRLAWELTNGPIPKGMSALHRCDNPPCVRPEHMFIGTQLENIADMVAKKRHRQGEMQSSAKLTDAAVRVIRAEYVPRCRYRGQRALARRFGVEQATIAQVLDGRTWTHVR